MKDAGAAGGGTVVAGIDTEIPGEPGQIERAAEWLRRQLGAQLGVAADRLNDARREAAIGWVSSAGTEFANAMIRARSVTDDLESGCMSLGDGLESFARDLRNCQSDMADVRRTATRQGLTVTGHVVEDPGPGPARPEMPPDGASEQVVEAHNRDVDAYDAHQRLITAYNDAAREARRIDRKYDAAAESLMSKSDWKDHAAYLINATDVLSAGASSAMETSLRKEGSRLSKLADDYATQARQARLDMAMNPDRYRRGWATMLDKVLPDSVSERLPWATRGEKYADDLASVNRLQSQADDYARLAENFDESADSARLRGRGIGGILGGAGFAVGIYSDIQDGESGGQALVSQGTGLGASILTGAAIGTVVPVPVVGTVLGAAGGAVVGLMADGAVDSLFDNGLDASQMWQGGVRNVSETTDAIKDGVSAVGDAIGGLFD